MQSQMLREEYNIEKQLVRKLDYKNIKHSSDYNLKEEKVFNIENELTEQEKLDILNYHTNGKCNHILNLIDLYWKDRSNLKRTSLGSINLRSLKAWIRKNDEMHVLRVDSISPYPVYYLFGQRYKLDPDRKTPNTEYGYKLLYSGKNIIHQWFHELLLNLRKQEEEYFIKHDPIQIKYSKVRELSQCLGYNISTKIKSTTNIGWNRITTGYSEIELDKMIETLENIEKYIDKEFKALDNYLEKRDINELA